jgi:hypothetical protein
MHIDQHGDDVAIQQSAALTDTGVLEPRSVRTIEATLPLLQLMDGQDASIALRQYPMAPVAQAGNIQI